MNDYVLEYGSLQKKLHELAKGIGYDEADHYKVIVSERDYHVLDYVVDKPELGHQIYGVEILIGKTKNPKIIKTNS
jgi:hypothetical protein